MILFRCGEPEAGCSPAFTPPAPPPVCRRPEKFDFTNFADREVPLVQTSQYQHYYSTTTSFNIDMSLNMIQMSEHRMYCDDESKAMSFAFLRDMLEMKVKK